MDFSKKLNWKKISLSISSILLVLIIAEVIMRFSWRMSGWVERPVYQRSASPYLRYELIPNAESGNLSINSNGFRGKEYSFVKPSNTFRIIMLGDSETLSIMLRQEETLASQLENLLNTKSQSLHYEVLNFGVEGYNTFQELEQLKCKGLRFNSDLIILNYVLNDPEPGEYYFDKTFLMRHSALVRYFTYRIKKALIRKERKRLNIKTEIDHFYYLHQPKYFNRVKKAILEMNDIAKIRRQALVVVIFPTSSVMVKNFKEDYPYWALHNLIKSIKADNIIFIDLIEEFNRLNLTPEGVSINYIYNESHKNASTLSVSANYIYGILKSSKLIPE